MYVATNGLGLSLTDLKQGGQAVLQQGQNVLQQGQSAINTLVSSGQDIATQAQQAVNLNSYLQQAQNQAQSFLDNEAQKLVNQGASQLFSNVPGAGQSLPSSTPAANVKQYAVLGVAALFALWAVKKLVF